jgi:hypothetical protein
MMTRRNLLFLGALTLGACAKPRKDPLPETAGAWKRASIEPEPFIPETLKILGCKQAFRAVYEGPARINVTAYEMSTGAGAFEALQKWRVERGSMPFHKEQFFLVVSGGDDKQMTEFSGALEKAMF